MSGFLNLLWHMLDSGARCSEEGLCQVCGSFQQVKTRFVTASLLHLWIGIIYYPSLWLLNWQASISLFKEHIDFILIWRAVNVPHQVRDNECCRFTDVTGTPSQIVSQLCGMTQMSKGLWMSRGKVFPSRTRESTQERLLGESKMRPADRLPAWCAIIHVCTQLHYMYAQYKYTCPVFYEWLETRGKVSSVDISIKSIYRYCVNIDIADIKFWVISIYRVFRYIAFPIYRFPDISSFSIYRFSDISLSRYIEFLDISFSPIYRVRRCNIIKFHDIQQRFYS